MCSLVYREINAVVKGHRCLRMDFTEAGLLGRPVGKGMLENHESETQSKDFQGSAIVELGFRFGICCEN